MVLGRSELLGLVEGENLLENFSLDCLGGAGYDLRLDRIYRLKSAGMLTVSDRRTPDVEEVVFDSYTLQPGDYVLVETLERVNLPSDIVAVILNRSTLFRCGCTLFNALVDPGFRGTLTFGLKNVSDKEFTVGKGARIAQIVFERVEGEATGYKGRYQGGKVV
jgi:deoxycytidine triphosphate deaminase